MIRIASSLFVLILVLGACGGGDSGAADNSDSTQPADNTTVTTAATDPPDEEGPADTTVASGTSGGGATATVRLENGEVFEFSILCQLDPPEEEFDFYVVSYDAPYNLDVSQFKAGSFGGAANISLYDSTTFDAVWDADSSLGSEVELTKNGNTVTGTGVFVQGGDLGNQGVRGELVANC